MMIKFIIAIVLFFKASDLITHIFEVEPESTSWYLLEIFSETIGFVAATFISLEAMSCLILFYLCKIVFIIFTGKGFFAILISCVIEITPLFLGGIIMGCFLEVNERITALKNRKN